MAHAYVFPGQGAQFPGMGKSLHDSNEKAKALFEKANDILQFRISDILFHGSAEELAQTKVTQPAIFLHSVIAYLTQATSKPDMVAGHSLGEFSALVANGVLSFEDALNLVEVRALAMQRACEANPSTMAAILGLDDKIVEDVCAKVEDTVVPANYNCPGQIVISGTKAGVEKACILLKEAGAKRALPLKVGGAFHSPLMQPAKEELETAIHKTSFKAGICPVYQNVTAKAETDPEVIKNNLIKQLTAPVRWTQSVQNMITDGANYFTECGPGKVLQGLIVKINRDVQVDGIG
jgi:[acyl-carrier-protein] S-malonyltransferase